MNIVITLPKKLAQLIYEGKKRIEVRKNFPKNFDPHNDVVFICEKGTGMVTGMFTIDAKGVSNSPRMIWERHATEIAIDEEWLFKYAENSKELYLWHIHNVWQFVENYSLKEIFHLDKAPQSYAYTDADWYSLDPWPASENAPRKKAVQ